MQADAVQGWRLPGTAGTARGPGTRVGALVGALVQRVVLEEAIDAGAFVAPT